MSNIILRIYVGFLAVSVLVMAFMLVTFKRDVSQREVTGGYQVLKDYGYNREHSQYTDKFSPLGVSEEYIFHFDKVEGSYRELLFYTVHQNVDVYVDGVRIYRMKPYISNEFGRTPGCVWNGVVLEDEDAGKEIKVVLYPVYRSSVGLTPQFYFGERYDISLDVIFSQLPALLLSVAGILLGILFVGYGFYNFRSFDADEGLLMLGCFAVIIGTWKLLDNEATCLLFADSQALYMAAFLLLHLACVPFVLFMRGINSYKEHKLWYVPIAASLGGMGITLALQLMDICDMRQMLWVTHVELVLSAGVTLYMTIYEIHNKGMNLKLKRNLLFLAICLLGMAIDMAVYYVSGGIKSTSVSMLSFVVYIFALGIFSVRDARQLMAIGMQAKTFERKAYHDQLTGLNNRMAYADYTTRDSFVPERCIVAVFDLNNLKKCNDTLGHEKGDLYIKECAHIIQNTFQDIGQCYRMGGDEFCVIIEHVSLEVCKKRMQRLQEAVKERNRQNPEIEMGIACGYERFDTRIDNDINDTSRRADKMMYREKFSMKQARES